MRTKTGNATVDRLGELNITGNVIPMAWFHTITNSNGKPYMLAIQVLAEIMYWYRPVNPQEKKDADVLECKKKFKSDKLQYSYVALADLFNVSKRQIKEVINFLIKLGVLHREFRTVHTEYGNVINNVMFLDLVVERLEELTFPENTEIPERARNTYGGYIQESSANEDTESCHEEDADAEPYGQVVRNLDTPSDKKTYRLDTANRHTNTKNTTKNITDYDNSITSYLTRDAYEKNFRKQIGYDEMVQLYHSEEELSILNTCVDVASNVYCSEYRHQRVSGEQRPTGVVKSLLSRLTSENMSFVIDSVMSVAKKIKNVRAYLLTCMINSVYSYRCSYENSVRSMICEGGCHA